MLYKILAIRYLDLQKPNMGMCRDCLFHFLMDQGENVTYKKQ